MKSKHPYASETLSVWDVFNGDSRVSKSENLYIIPEYQRYYSWGKEHVNDLLRDIEESLKNQDDGFFLGPFLFVEDDEPGTYEIIDGQQRIMTLSMVISGIMHTLFNSNILYKDEIIKAKKCLWHGEGVDAFNLDQEALLSQDCRIKFALKKNDTHYRFIIAKNEWVSSSPLSEAYHAINNYFSGKSMEYCRDFLEYVIDNIFVVSIVTKRHNHSINKIFETLNDRGMPLTQIELFKNFSLGHLGGNKKRREEFTDYHMRLGTEKNVDKYFFVYSQVINGYDKNNKKSNWYRFWKKIIMDQSSHKDITSYIQTTLQSCYESIELYQACLSGSDKHWQKWQDKCFYQDLISIISFLSKFQITHPLILSLLMAHSKNAKFTDENFYKCVQAVYVFLARVWLVKGLSRTAKIEEILVKIAHQINAIKKSQKISLADIIDLINNTEDDEFIGLIEDKKFKKSMLRAQYPKDKSPPKFILDIIEDATSTYSKDEIHLERVASDSTEVGASIEELSEYKDMLGNMILIEEEVEKELNKAIRNNFKDRIKIYKQSVFSMTAELSVYDHWGSKEIIKRQANIVDKLVVKLSFPTL